jgi:aminopeptidase
LSEDPDGLREVDQKKYSAALKEKNKIIKPMRDLMDGKYKWCIAAVPGEKWAKKIFPNDDTPEAIEKLWDAILKVSRAEGDPIENYKKHNEELKKKCDYLNSLEIETLVYKSSNGTDFSVGLMPNGVFLGGGEYTLGGEFFNANIPTEEVFTSPMRGKAEGTVVSSMPLSHRGQLIENFSITFKDGKVVSCKAEKNGDLLNEIIHMDEGAAYIGECALVPFDSPIRNSGILFYNTLFDENAACHIALGSGFCNCVKDYEKYTIEQCRKFGVNDSAVHVDFMIGTEDLEITAISRSGKKYDIFKNGNWAF